ncbi:hypothetical protein CEUSTIGMA_g7119.t1 [Chlamydomonas eustigma]|uniref:Elongation factor Ts, mitochondrial n=1 Tax=Chlamydomonas eustigma TaxID=1157962 RepID=A0A250X9C7_9CHLO|nr:hypothetical protein CEUSTIGMA_g7119.t1 [Chlamydomonas eustigma]|eukprot:GAX79678.1 hypothetical protein CEUSTIGMA_g7119.t1 [Chlamydomonas eustigma]
MLKAASGKAVSYVQGPNARLNSVASVSKKRPVAFKGSRSHVTNFFASAEEGVNQQADTPVARNVVKAAKRVVTVPLASVKAGDEFEGTVTAVETFGAFVNFGAEKDGLVHISQLSNKFVSSASQVVKVNEKVKVRVLSFDSDSGKIALSMKSASGAMAGDISEVEGGDSEDVSGSQGDDFSPEEGHEFIYADSVADFQFPFQMEEEDAELTVNSVANFEEADSLEVEFISDLPIPLNELVTGKVTRVEESFALLSINYKGKEVKGFLERDEAKIPAAKLSAEDLSSFVDEGDEVPAYISSDFDDMKQYYKEGDLVQAFVLEYTDKGLNVTQYTDAEVEADGLELDDDDEGEISNEVLSVMGDLNSFDVMALEPEDLLEMEGIADEVALNGGAGQMNDSDAVADYKINGRGPLTGSLFTAAGDLSVPYINFPDRPSGKVSSYALNNINTVDKDFDGDEIFLEDLWQQTIHVPKDALKKLGLKIKIDENGEAEAVEREGVTATEDEDFMLNLSGDHKERVARFVADLLEEDEEEAELPALAMRRPVVMALAVQSISAADVKSLRDKTGAGMMDCKKALAENDGDAEKAVEWLRQKGLSGADKKAGRVAAEGAICTYIHPGSRLGVLLEVNCETDFVAASDKFQSLIGELGMIIAASDVLVVSPEDVPSEVLAKERDVEMGKEDLKSKPEAVRAKIVEGRIEKIKNTLALVNQDSLRDPSKAVSDIVKETIAAVGENIQIRRFIKFKLGEGMEKKNTDFAAEVAHQTQAKVSTPKVEEPKKEEATIPAKAAVQVAATVVKELRDKTGAGMMDCKKALAENNGDMEASVEWLRKKGLAGADKKAGRLAVEGVVASYIHPGSRLGVLLEVNCETDFVAASDGFQSLVNGLAMQIAASPQVQYVSAEDIPAEVFAREKAIEMGREDLLNKPVAIRAKIAEGRVQKLAQEMALLPQPYLMDQTKTVEQAVKEAIATIGEKISVRRFEKFVLGEGIEKKVLDLAADVAAMTSKSS